MDVSTDQSWDSKDEPCRANNWKTQEVIDLLNTIKTKNLMKGCPSGNQLGHIVEPLLGYTRTAFQITGKLKNLRKSYLLCKRKGRTPAALRDCPYYDMLSEIYGSEKSRHSDARKTGTSGQDVELSSEKGIESMFRVIKELDLSSDSKLRLLSGKALRLISKMLLARGIRASAERVKSTLVSLRKTYVDANRGKRARENSMHLRYYDDLHSLWGPSKIQDSPVQSNKLVEPKIEANASQESDAYWSDPETLVLLNSIKALNIVKEAKKNSDKGAKKLQSALRKAGYLRTRNDVKRKLNDLKNTFQRTKSAESRGESATKFPFYDLYKSIFRSSFFGDPDSSGSQATEEGIVETPRKKTGNEDNVVLSGKVKHSRSRAWSDDETLLMLSLLEELDLKHHIAHRLSFEVANEVVKPLRELGYPRSALQIQIKLRNLRKSYYKCIRTGSTEIAIGDCPFYYKLDDIFKKRNEPRKLRTFKKSRTIDKQYADTDESYNDHSCPEASSLELSQNESKTAGESDRNNEDSQVWLPVEAICGEDSFIIDEQKDAGSVSIDKNASNPDETDDTEWCPSIDEADESNDLDDEPEEFTSPASDDTGQCSQRIDRPVREKSRAQGKPGTSLESSIQPGSSTLWTAKQKLEKIVAHPYSLRANEDSSPTLGSPKTVMAEVLRHEKLLQRQHHVWLERQFKIQRKHDRDQRELLIKELREFRKSVTSVIPKQQIPNDQRFDSS